MAQTANMQQQTIAVFDRSKRKDENPKKNNGDFHVLMAQADSVSKSLQKRSKNKLQKHTRKKDSRRL